MFIFLNHCHHHKSSDYNFQVLFKLLNNSEMDSNVKPSYMYFITYNSFVILFHFLTWWNWLSKKRCPRISNSGWQPARIQCSEEKAALLSLMQSDPLLGQRLMLPNSQWSIYQAQFKNCKHWMWELRRNSLTGEYFLHKSCIYLYSIFKFHYIETLLKWVFFSIEIDHSENPISVSPEKRAPGMWRESNSGLSRGCGKALT